MSTAGPQIGNSSHDMLFRDCTKNIDLPRKFKPPSFRRWFFSQKGRRKGEGKESITPPEECKPYLEAAYVNENLTVVGDADLNMLVQLPRGLDCNEWLASHTVSFFEHINLMYGTLSELCLPSGCTSMTGPGNTIYQWVDEKGKKLRCGAPQYIEYTMSYTEKALNDEAVFPTKYGNAFPSTFLQTVRKLHKLLFHVLAHIYHAHYTHILRLTLQAHLNMLFHHFMTFGRTFELLDEKDTDVLEDLFQALRKARVKQLLEADGDLPPPPPPLTTDSNSTVTPSSGQEILPPPCAVANNTQTTCPVQPSHAKDPENKENINNQEEFPPPPPPIAS